MAEKKSSAPSFEQIMRDIEARNFSPIYILMGEEPYYIDLITNKLAETVLQPEEQDFNQTIVFGSDVTAAQVADLARSYPMMAEYKVVIVKEAQNLKDWTPLEKYVEKQLSKSTVLVLCHKNGVLDRRKKATSAIISGTEAAGGVVFESKKKRDYELPAFIEGYLKEKNASIDYKSSQMIAEHIGADLSRLTSEIDKVLISLPEENKRITPEIVEREIGVSKEFNTFELNDAIVNKNVFKANQIIKYFDKNPKSGSIYKFLPNIFIFFQNLMIAYYSPNKTSEEAVAQHLGLKSKWQARDYVTALRNYSGKKTLEIISKIREVDAKSKGLDNQNTTVGDLMKELIFFILH